LNQVFFEKDFKTITPFRESTKGKRSERKRRWVWKAPWLKVQGRELKNIQEINLKKEEKKINKKTKTKKKRKKDN